MALDFLHISPLSKKNQTQRRRNPQYYVIGNHEPIIEPATWDLVQTEIIRRAKPGESSHQRPCGCRCFCYRSW
ncbi:recombinase family protein [Dermabacteraceae bacterium P7074]